MSVNNKLSTSDKAIWTASAVITLLLLLFITYDLIKTHQIYVPDREQLTTVQEIDKYFESQSKINPELANFTKVPTGIFLQSLRFTGPLVVHISGYVWQTYTKGKHDGLTRGFKFPESIQENIQKVYERTVGEKTTIGWYFEASISEHIDYSQYPLDNQVVWIRLWHADFDKNILLTPDLSAYKRTNMEDAFGLDSNIVLDGFELHETFFNYKKHPYDTNFGLGDSIVKDNIPELYFSVALKRNIINGFILHAMPALIVIVTAFALCLNINSQENNKFSVESNIVSIISACSGLIFVTILINLNLRRWFIGGEFTFIECIYLWVIVMISLIAFNALAVAKPKSILAKALAIQYHNNIIIKSLFMPVFLVGVIVISRIFFD